MGWTGKFIVALVGIILLSAGLWFFGILCIAYLAISFRPRPKDGGKRASGRPAFRFLLAGGLLLLSGVAYGSGGTYSTILLFTTGLLALAWSHLPIGSVFAELVPIEESILLRSKYFPFSWHALAELKPGPDDFPRAVSSISGTLMIFVDSGRAYVLSGCRAWRRSGAEDQIIFRLKDLGLSRRSRAYILPLEAKSASALLLQRLSAVKVPEDFAANASGLPELLVVGTRAGRIYQASGYEISPPGDYPSLSFRCKETESRPLLWELLETIGKRSRWPGPDDYSNLLDSVSATRGEPLGERLGGIEGSGSSVMVQSLGGDRLGLSRAQLRAVVSIYS
jgi:hypothetical protein